MQKSLFLVFLFCFLGISFSQTTFLVLSPGGKPVAGVWVVRNDKGWGETDQDGKFTIPKLKKGIRLDFIYEELIATYIIQKYTDTIAEQEIRLHPRVHVSSASQIYTEVEEPAMFPGGSDEMKAFIKENLQYPQVAREANLTGKCYLRFTVETDGRITGVKILKGISGCPECDAEAVRVIEAMPAWIPGKRNRRNVPSYVTQPVIFEQDR